VGFLFTELSFSGPCEGTALDGSSGRGMASDGTRVARSGG